VNKSANTVKGYIGDARRLLRWLAAEQRPTDLVAVTTADIKAYLASMVTGLAAPSSTARAFRSLQQLYRWLDDEDEIDASPMARMSPPHVPDIPVPVIPPRSSARSSPPIPASRSPPASRRAGGPVASSSTTSSSSCAVTSRSCCCSCRPASAPRA
jgi:hypothetical protein